MVPSAFHILLPFTSSNLITHPSNWRDMNRIIFLLMVQRLFKDPASSPRTASTFSSPPRWWIFLHLTLPGAKILPTNTSEWEDPNHILGGSDTFNHTEGCWLTVMKPWNEIFWSFQDNFFRETPGGMCPIWTRTKCPCFLYIYNSIFNSKNLRTDGFHVWY